MCDWFVSGSEPGIVRCWKHPTAICVQRFDDSLNPAIHITYRISLRSSSSPEPRDPPLRGVDISVDLRKRKAFVRLMGFRCERARRRTDPVKGPPDAGRIETLRGSHRRSQAITEKGGFLWFFGLFCVNDPSAGSPTETLLRLLLPLDDKVH